ncbi:PorT family protein [Halosquirtibacter xylanolyticus]|uniref:porin family protein n=1 Tax=Halosquirtibacter xylanolyticus TaxID=3374599 RepID=UPI00374A28D6|nr:PorT family protein [Prolixibacteraceae bacterium]
MKKLFIVAILSLVSTGAFAQLPVNLGLKFGWNSSTVSTSNLSTNLKDYSPTNNNGYLIGAFARVNLKSWYIQPEFYYAVKKGETSFDYTGNLEDPITVNQTIDLKTVDIPVLLGYRIFDAKLLSMNVFTGPVMSINTGSEIDFGDTPKNVKDKMLNGLKDPSGVDWAYQLGLGFDVALLTIDARYEWGLSNLENGLTNVKFNQKSNMFTLSVGWRFL